MEAVYLVRWKDTAETACWESSGWLVMTQVEAHQSGSRSKEPQQTRHERLHYSRMVQVSVPGGTRQGGARRGEGKTTNSVGKCPGSISTSMTSKT